MNSCILDVILCLKYFISPLWHSAQLKCLVCFFLFTSLTGNIFGQDNILKKEIELQEFDGTIEEFLKFLV